MRVLSLQSNQFPAPGAAAGVASLNSITGAVTLAAGSGVSVTPAGGIITIAATGGGSVEFPIVSSDPGSPTSGQAWVLATAYVDPTAVTDTGDWFGGGILVAISPYVNGDAVDLFGADFELKQLTKFFLTVDDGFSVAQSSIAGSGNPGLQVTYNPGAGTLSGLITALNSFSNARIGKNIATLAGGFTGAELVADYTAGGGITYTFLTDQTIAAGVLKIQGSGVVYAFSAAITV